MGKLTDNEIIKALERCGQHRECCYCNSLEECGNKRVLTASVLDLINRKDAEVERLNAVSEICGECHQKYAEKIAKAKSEAIKELAERLKNEIISDTTYGHDTNQHGGYYDYQIKIGDIPEYIDNLVAEMVGE